LGIQAQASKKTPENIYGELDVLIYNATLKAHLIEAESITDSDLNNLALARQNSVIFFIKGHSALKENQLRTSELVTKKSDNGWLNMSFKLDAL